MKPSDTPSDIPSQAPSRPPIDFGPRAFRRPDDPVIIRITNVEVSFRGVPLEALAVSDRRKLEAVTTEWYNDFYSSRDLPHLQWDVQLSLQKLAEDALQLLFEISLGSKDMDLVSQPDPSVYLWMPWEDQEANQDYVERVVTAMPETFDGLIAPMDVPRILTPTVLLPADREKNTTGSLSSTVSGRMVLGVFAGVFVCMCTVAVAVFLSKMVRRNTNGRPGTTSRIGGKP